MDKKTLQKEVLEKKYNPKRWIEVLTDYLGIKQFHIKAQPIILPSNEIATEALELGGFKTIDDRIVGVYQVTLTSKPLIGINKVGLRNLFKSIISYNIDAALIVFIQGEKWRFSYVSEIRTVDGKKETEPKRYTYLFGEGESCRTAADRFDKLKGKPLYLNDLFEAFSVETLTKEFYKDLFDWYQWAQLDNIGITFPNDISTESDDRIISEHLIRLITRIMFVWFIKRKELIPENIFDSDFLSKTLNDFKPYDYKQDNFYRAILQNLFFATLNKKIEEREFATDSTYIENKEHYGIKNLYRYSDEFIINQLDVIKLFSEVPFLNGGLFECLDKEKPNSKGKIVYSDGFSRKKDRQSRAFVPNIVFFDEQRGLLTILKRYNFTIEENSPLEIQVALDPELLGKVFENLLGTFNPETKETARKLSGSFYTPREIVDYMVNESLIAYLINKEGEKSESDIKNFVNNSIISDDFSKIKFRISNALREIKVLDPACGSGAFPMGLLNKMVDLLSKLENHETDVYDLKLHIIENCIYGIDIQTIAVQISKLRFFISLIINQEKDNTKDNFGILPLPNLETKFVAANTLINLNKSENQLNLFEDPEVEKTKIELFDIRHKHFSATNSKDKKKYRQEDERLRDKLSDLFEQNQFYSHEEARLLSSWNPYDQNASSPFFESEWMFNIKNGFDLIIGNPPYLRIQGVQNATPELIPYAKKNYESAKKGNWDLYVLFDELGYKLLKNKGMLSFIQPHKFFQGDFGVGIRNYIAKEKCLYQIVHFGAEQMFESATNYTCLFFMQRKIQKTFRYIKVDKPDDWLQNTSSAPDYILPQPEKDQKWAFTSGEKQNILDKLQKQPQKLGDITRKIFQGIPTGADKVFVLQFKYYESDRILKCYSVALEKEITIEVSFVKPFLMGKDVRRYEKPEVINYVLFPYKLLNDKYVLFDELVIKEQFPLAWQYLVENQETLVTREHNRFEKTWWQYSRPQNLKEFETIKIMTPDIANQGKFTIDKGFNYHTTTIYSFSFKEVGVTEKAEYWLGVLNSKLLWFFLQSTGNVLRGGFFRFKTEYLKPFPAKRIDFKNKKEKFCYDKIIDNVNTILEFKETGKETFRLEAEIDAMVFILYGFTEDEMMTTLLQMPDVSEAERREIQFNYKEYNR